MKRIIVLAAFTAALFAQNLFAQDSTSQSLQKVITSYLDIKNALTKDNADSVQAYAQILYEDLQAVPSEKLSSDQNKIWMEYYEALINNTAKIKNGSELKTQRKQFSELSLNYYKLLEEMKINTIDLYYQYCPMANAYWISENSKISNPYYGKKMISCGSTKETLTANK